MIQTISHFFFVCQTHDTNYTCASVVFSRLISIVMAGVSQDRAQTSLDDILISGFDFEDHLYNLDEIFTRLASHGLKLKVCKYALFQPKVNYLWHEITPDAICPLISNVQRIQEFTMPRSVTQLSRFNGMVLRIESFYKIVQKYSPLYAATSGKTLLWTKECSKTLMSKGRTKLC